MKTYYLFLIFLFAGFYSCNKDKSNDDIFQEEKDKCYLTKVFEGGDLIAEYEYNEMKQCTLYRSGTQNSYKAEYYNGKIFKYTYKNSFSNYTYYYLFDYLPNGNVIKSRYDKYDKLTQKTIYKMNNKVKCLAIGTLDYNEFDELTGYSTIEYFGNNCSRIATYFDKYGNETSTRKYYVGNKKNAYRHAMPFAPELYYIQNNIEKREVIENGQLKYSYDATYEFNQNNYPIKATYKYLDGTEKVYEYEYDCL